LYSKGSKFVQSQKLFHLKHIKMNIALWVVQGILAFMFGMAGVIKTIRPIDKMAEKMPWIKDYPAGVVRLVGISEFLGAVGLVVPMLTGIAPILTPVAAAALALVMVFAAIYHFRKGEMKEIGFNAVLFILCVFVVYGRFYLLSA
jgi:uncharacterized membrane protein YphA (DoxX/SURF4 family)